MLVWNDGSNKYSIFSEKKEELHRADDVQFVTNTKVTYVPDTNAFIAHYDIIRGIMEEARQELCYVAIPQRVVSELDGLAKNRDCALLARKSLRLLVEFTSHVIVEPFLEYMKDETLYAQTQIPRHERSDNSIVNYASKLLKNERHTVVMLTEDKAVLAKFGSKARTPPTYKHNIISSSNIKLETRE